MKRTRALFLIPGMILTAVTALASSPDIRFTPGAADFSYQNYPLEVTRESSGHTTISLANPDFQLVDTVLNYASYQAFWIPGVPFESVDGRPAIPHLTRFYSIPNTGSVEFVVRSADFEIIDDFHPFPMQIEDHHFASQVRKDESVYGRDAWYPSDIVAVSEPMIFRDYRVVCVTLYPVQVNPVTQQARVYRQIDVDLVSNDVPGENEIRRSRHHTRSFTPLYKNLIANLDEGELDDFPVCTGTYLILCRTEAQQWADSLALWKRRCGFDVVIDARTNWTHSTMRQAIRDLYNNGDPPLEYVCIMGDVTGTFGMPTNPTDYDHYFALGNDNDGIEDIAVGRLSAESNVTFGTIHSKLMHYERDPYVSDPTWFRRGFLYAGTSSGISSNEILMLWARNQFYEFTGLNDINVNTHTGSVSNTLIGQRLTEGVSFFLWRGTVVGEMSASAATSMSPSYKLPVVLTITCGTGDFDGATSLSEAWLRAGTANSPQGGICGIGSATWNTHVTQNNTMTGGLVYNVCNLGVERLGVAIAGAKAQLYAAFYPHTSDALNFSRWNNLMGEPGLLMWTDTPAGITVNCPLTLNVGTRRVAPVVEYTATGEPVEGAMVVLWKGEETYARALTDENGLADLPVSVITPGVMTLTVTKYNHQPYLADINCVSAAQMVTASSWDLDDDNAGGSSGNNNGILNPGEIIDLDIYLKNFGTSGTAANVSAVMTTSHPQISILQGTGSYPSLAPGDSALGVQPFRIEVQSTMRHRDIGQLTLTVTTSDGTTYSSIPLECAAAQPVYYDIRIENEYGNEMGWLEPGENGFLIVSIRNEGVVDMSGVSATLIPQSVYVSVIEDQASFGTVPAGSIGSNNSDAFELYANEMTYPGHLAPMLLVLSDLNGFQDSLVFTLPVGSTAPSDPTGPDAYGYFAYDNTDVDYEWHRPYNYIDIRDEGTRLSLEDPGEQQPNGPTYSTVVSLPFDFEFYGVSYSQLTICSNGWAAFGDQSELDQFRNYPIPGQQAPDALLAPFWDDLATAMSLNQGVYVYNDEPNHQYIIQWRARGAFQTNQQDFEIILLDPDHYPTRDGSGIVVFQYALVTEMSGDWGEISYSTVGIQAPGGLVGLQYSYWAEEAPGAAPLATGRSIVFTTDAFSDFGTISGTVVDAANDAPLEDVEVALLGRSARVYTDELGQYVLENVLADVYTVRASLTGYNDAFVENVVVTDQSTTVVDFEMLHPEISLSTDQIDVTLPGDPYEAAFTIENTGNGPLTYDMRIEYSAGDRLDEEWDFLGDIDISAQTGNLQIQGCEFLNDNWWITAASLSSGQNQIYRFDRDGVLVDSISQPGSSQIGWHDLASDGQYLYGSDSNQLVGVNAAGTVRETIPLPVAVNPARAVAYNPLTDHFWVADYSTDILEINRDGEEVKRVSGGLQITGLAWYPSAQDGYKLYVFGRDQSNQHAVVTRINPETGDRVMITDVSTEDHETSGGGCITNGWNSILLVFAGVISHPAGDYIGIWELDFNTTWISVSPMSGQVSAENEREVNVVFDPTGLRDDTYAVNLIISNNSLNSPIVLPVSLTSWLAVPGSPAANPERYALHQNYPNPFNGMTSFAFDLKQGGHTTLKVYNLLGQEVATVLDEYRTAGSHRLSFGMDHFASGIYLYRLESGPFSQTRKLVLMK